MGQINRKSMEITADLIAQAWAQVDEIKKESHEPQKCIKQQPDTRSYFEHEYPVVSTYNGKWYSYTNKEKRDYRLRMYTKNICCRLTIEDSLANTVCDMMVRVYCVIKQMYGDKRNKNKDGLVLCCINYVIPERSVKQMADTLCLRGKYVSIAEDIFLECMKKQYIRYQCKPTSNYNTALQIVKAIKIHTYPGFLDKIHNLVSFCEQNDVIMEHTPQVLAATCIYYLLKLDSRLDDRYIKTYSELCGVSSVTLLKVYTKLHKQTNCALHLI